MRVTSLHFLDFGAKSCCGRILFLAACWDFGLAADAVDPAAEAGVVSDAEECTSSLAG